MKVRADDFWLGVVTIGILALFVGSIVFVYPQMGDDTREITVLFPHEVGMAPLKEGSPVMLSSALQVGKVSSVATEEMQLPGDARPNLVIVVKADVSSALALYEGVKIGTAQPAVGGNGSLVINDVGAVGQPRDPSKPIIGTPPSSFAAAIDMLTDRLFRQGGLMDQVENLLNPDAEGQLVNRILVSLRDINALTAELRTQLDPREQATLMYKLQEMMSDLAATTGSIRAQMASDDGATILGKLLAALDTVQAALADAQGMIADNRPVVRATFENVRGVTQQLNEQVLPAVVRELDPEKTGALLNQLHAGMTQLNASLANVQEITSNGRTLLLTNRPALETTINNLQEMSTQLRLTSEEVRVAPWKLLYRPTDNESRQAEVFAAARTFAEAATELDQAAGRLKAVVEAAPAGVERVIADEELEQIRTALRSAFTRFQRAESYLWDELNR